MPTFHFSLLQTKQKYACSISLWQKQWITRRLSNGWSIIVSSSVLSSVFLLWQKPAAHKSKARTVVFIPPRYLAIIMQLSGLWVHPGGWKTVGLWPVHCAVRALSQDPPRPSIWSIMWRIPLIWRNPKRTAANPIWDTWLAELITAQGHCPHTGTSGSCWHTEGRQLGELNAYKCASC